MVFNCVICYALLSADRENKITYCGHLYHSDCILNWLERNNTCPVCRETLLENDLFQVYPTFDEENDAHLDSNCPAHALTDELNNFCDENRNLKEDLTEMREKYNESNYNLELKQSILASLELQLEKMTLEKQDLELKLTSMDEHKKKILDEYNELELNFDSILIENNQICNKMKENEGELKLVQETLMLSNSELDKKTKELSSANKKIEGLECLKESLLLQNINYKRKNLLNKCDICKELINQVDQSTKISECKVELRQSPTKKKSDSSKESDTRPSEFESDGNQANLLLGELSQHRLFKISPARAIWKREMGLEDDMSHC